MMKIDNTAYAWTRMAYSDPPVGCRLALLRVEYGRFDGTEIKLDTGGGVPPFIFDGWDIVPEPFTAPAADPSAPPDVITATLPREQETPKPDPDNQEVVVDPLYWRWANAP